MNLLCAFRGIVIKMFKSLVKLFIFFATSFVVLCATPNQNIINIDMLSQQANKEHKHLLLFFHKFGCSFCEQMIEGTLDDDQIEALIDKRFIFVDIGIDDEGTVIHKKFKGGKHEYAKSLEITFYPTVGFVDGNNSIVYGSIGYRDTERFTTLLQYMYTGAYKTLDYEAFKMKLEFESDE